MGAKITITAGDVTVEAVLNDSATAKLVADELPIEASASTWGDEIYFSIPIHTGPEDAQEVVEMGDIAYWPPGNAFCIFFGPTPMSEGDEIRPASPVNIFGKINGDPTSLKSLRSGTKVSKIGRAHV